MVIYPSTFNPFHQQHYAAIKKASKLGDHILIAINHANGEKPSARIPFYGDDRERMIRDTLENDNLVKSCSIIQYHYVEDGLVYDYYGSIYDVARKEYKKLFNRDPETGDIATVYDSPKIHPNWRRNEYYPIVHIKTKQSSGELEDAITQEILTKCLAREELPIGTKKFIARICGDKI